MDARLQRIQAAKDSENNQGASRRRRFVAQVIAASDEKSERKEATFVKESESETTVKLTELKLETTKDKDSSSEDEESSADEEELKKLLARPTKPMLKPVFVPKELRKIEGQVDPLEGRIFESESEEMRKQKAEEARSLVADILKRDLEAEMNRSKNGSGGPLDPTTGIFDPFSVDDTDDPANFEEEYLAWKLRELLRIKTERDEREKWEREQAELERIRSMTEEERRRLDEEKMEEWASKPQSQYKFLQKYYHKGAFFQEEHKDLLERDYAQPTLEDKTNRDVLPEVMQVRNFGKKGRTKWTHLTSEDTTAFDYGWGAKDNPNNLRNVSKMGGMKGDLDNPSKRHKPK